MAKKITVDVQALYAIIEAQSETIKLLNETIANLRNSSGAVPVAYPTPYIPYQPLPYQPCTPCDWPPTTSTVSCVTGGVAGVAGVAGDTQVYI